MTTSDAERLARLEAQQQEGQRVHEALFDRMEDQQERLDSISSDVSEIKGTLQRYKGFAGGVMFALTSLGVLIGALLAALWKKLVG